MNEYLTIYSIADFLAYHFISNNKATLDEERNIVFITNPNEFEEIEKKLYSILLTLQKILGELNDIALKTIKDKYQNILNGFENNKLFNSGFMPVFIALAILEHYSLYKGEKKYNISPRTVKKVIKRLLKATNIAVMDRSFLNSMVLGTKFYQLINKE